MEPINQNKFIRMEYMSGVDKLKLIWKPIITCVKFEFYLLILRYTIMTSKSNHSY